ncbi:MAG: SPFH domain-containing protein [Candidatus Odinarchaeota archaeon]
MAALDPVTIAIVVIGILFIMLLLFVVSRYRKYRPNEYVIHLRYGKVRSAGTGGSLYLLPLFDEIVVIPTTVQQTLLEARERVVSHEYQDVSLTAFIYWRVNKPDVAYNKVSWNPTASDYVEKIIKNAAESIIRTTCANMAIEDIIREREQILKNVSAELHSLMSDWGMTVESVEIRDVEVLDPSLKANLEAIKKIAEEQKAKLRTAEMAEITKLRELEVENRTGTADQEVKLNIEAKAKERQIRIQQLEQERAIVAAETERKQIQIQAEAERFRRVKQEIDVEVERMTRQAEAKKIALLAEAEGEAGKIRQRLLAEAEGLLEQAKSLSTADEKLIQLKTVEILPEVFSKIKVDRVMAIGEGGDAFKSIAQIALPFLQMVQDMQRIKDEEKRKK